MMGKAAVTLGQVLGHTKVGDLAVTIATHSPGHQLGPHAHATAALTGLISGSADETGAFGSWTAGPGVILFKPAECDHANFYRSHSVEFLLECGRERWSRLAQLAPSFQRPTARNHPMFRDVGSRLARAALSRDPLAPLLTEGLALAMLAEFGAAEAADGNIPASTLELARERLLSGMSVSDVAASLEIGEAKLARCYRRRFGFPISVDRLRTRAWRAWDMVRNERTSLADIAVRCGYYDQSHMTREFRRWCGITPSDCRRTAIPAIEAGDKGVGSAFPRVS